MIPPLYTLFPSAVLRMKHIPIHLRWTYLLLYALAWTNEYHYVNENFEQLAAIISELEGEPIRPRGVRQRLSDLSEHGLVERQKVGSRYRTYLLVRHDQSAEQSRSGAGDAPSVTTTATGDAPGVTQRHLPNNITDDVDDLSIQHKHHHHQYSNRGDVEVFQENKELLKAMGIDEPVRSRLASEQWVTPEYLEGWMAKRAAEAARGNILGPGYMVIQIGKAEEPCLQRPADQESRYRYIKGKYKDYIKY